MGVVSGKSGRGPNFFRVRFTILLQNPSSINPASATVLASLIKAFFMSSIIIFIVGFVCDQKCSGSLRGPLIKHWILVYTLQKGPMVPLHESDTTQCHEEQGIKQENVAYGPISVFMTDSHLSHF